MKKFLSNIDLHDFTIQSEPCPECGDNLMTKVKLGGGGFFAGLGVGILVGGIGWVYVPLLVLPQFLKALFQAGYIIDDWKHERVARKLDQRNEIAALNARYATLDNYQHNQENEKSIRTETSQHTVGLIKAGLIYPKQLFGMSFEKIKVAKAKIEAATIDDTGEMSLEDQLRALPKIANHIDSYIELMKRGKLGLAIDCSGEDVIIDPFKNNTLISSTTRAGKSMVLSLFFSFFIQQKPGLVKVHLADNGNNTFSTVNLPVAITNEQFYMLLQDIYSIYETRKADYARLARDGDRFNTIGSYRVKTGIDHADHVVIIDEANGFDFDFAPNKGMKSIRKLFSELGHQGIKFGIHFIMCGQDMRVSELLKGGSRSSFKNRIQLATDDTSGGLLISQAKKVAASLESYRGSGVVSLDSKVKVVQFNYINDEGEKPLPGRTLLQIVDDAGGLDSVRPNGFDQYSYEYNKRGYEAQLGSGSDETQHSIIVDVQNRKPVSYMSSEPDKKQIEATRKVIRFVFEKLSKRGSESYTLPRMIKFACDRFACSEEEVKNAVKEGFKLYAIEIAKGMDKPIAEKDLVVNIGWHNNSTYRKTMVDVLHGTRLVKNLV